MPTLPVPQAFALALQHHQAGRLTEAGTIYRQILAIEPRHGDARNNLGVILVGEGKLDEAVEQYRQALECRPDFPEASNNLGNALKDRGRLDEAVDAYRRALLGRADYPEAHMNLGLALAELDRWDEAVASCRRAVELGPHSAQAHNVLGTVFARRRQFAEAVSAYGRALEIAPRYLEARVNLGVALAELRRLDEALAVYRQVLEMKPDFAEVWTHLGNALWGRGRNDEAMAAYRHAIQLRPDLPQAHNYLGFVLKDVGHVEEAVDAFRQALRLQPGYREAHSNLVYTLPFHPGADDLEIAGEKQRWSRQFAEPLQCLIRSHANEPDPERRLRIGYVSPDFRDHVFGRYILPLLKGHERREFEIFCYSGVVRPDAVTEEIRQWAGTWRDVAGVRDEAMAEMIRQDGVDILVDLTQHMAGDRLEVFARKPAPVQVSFGGTPESTGLEAIAYRIGDRYLERAPEVASETVFLLDSFWCYDPCGADVAVNPLPASRNGYVTFGTLNNFCKVNEAVLRLWGRVLAGVEGSRLVLLSPVGSHRRRVLAVLGQEGVGEQRVEFVESRPRQAYLEMYHRLDIALDPFPSNGHTTSLDAMWMGVPVISVAGQRAVGRAGGSELSNLGLEELLAFSEADYVKMAAQLAHDLPRLAELRRTLRPRMEASPVMNAPRFVRGIEAAYRAMWRKWCAEKSPATA